MGVKNNEFAWKRNERNSKINKTSNAEQSKNTKEKRNNLNLDEHVTYLNLTWHCSCPLFSPFPSALLQIPSKNFSPSSSSPPASFLSLLSLFLCNYPSPSQKKTSLFYLPPLFFHLPSQATPYPPSHLAAQKKQLTYQLLWLPKK